MVKRQVNILVVDGGRTNLLGYHKILDALGERLICASSGAESLKLLAKNDVALVLTNVDLPDMSGLDLAARIRRIPQFHSIAILFVSEATLTDRDRIRGYRSGGMDFIRSPIIPELLRTKVSLFADLFRKTRELERLNNALEERVTERTVELEARAAQVRDLNDELTLRLDELKERAELMELASEAIIVRRLDGTIRFWNSGAAAMYGWTAAEARGRRLHEMLQTEFPLPFDEIQIRLGRGERWEGNLIQRAKDGHEMVVACRKSLKRDPKEGDVVLEICRDITSQLQAEEALRRSEKLAAMGKMAGIVAHEINNPLGAIMNLFYLLERHPSLDDKARHYAAMAEQELLRVAHITRQTLAFYRDSSHSSRVSIPNLLDDILALESHQIAKKSISVVKRYRTDLAVEAVAGELKQVFLNLINNAVEAMPDGGELRLHVFRTSSGQCAHPNCVRVSILDTGAGITPEDAKHLFQPFFSTKSTKGTGLGLWISRGIVQKYEGRIAFRSVSVGGPARTCFSVLLPAVPTADPARDASTGAAASSSGASEGATGLPPAIASAA